MEAKLQHCTDDGSEGHGAQKRGTVVLNNLGTTYNCITVVSLLHTVLLLMQKRKMQYGFEDHLQCHPTHLVSLFQKWLQQEWLEQQLLEQKRLEP